MKAERLTGFSCRTWLAVAALVALAGMSRGAGRTQDDGFIASRMDDAAGNRRVRAAGPFYESSTQPNGDRIWALRPFFSSYTSVSNRSRATETVWPLANTHRQDREYSSRFLLAFYHDADTANLGSQWHYWFLPLYFQGRDKHGRAYAAVFPFGGRVNEFLTHDENTFFLWPLTAWSRVNDVETRDIIWPFYSHTWGGKWDRRRFFPFYGHNTHKDDYERRFILWPFYTSADYYRAGSSGHGFLFFPLYGHVRRENQEEWTWLPPFFKYGRVTQANGNTARIIHCPWPIYQSASGNAGRTHMGATVQRSYLWPVYGHREVGGLHTWFYLWPFIWRTECPVEGGLRQRDLTVVPLLFSERRTPAPGAATNAPAATPSSYFKLWPVWVSMTAGSNRSDRALAFWPLKNTPAVERLWAPLWTLFSNTRVGDNADAELLWGLYRYQRRGELARRFSIFPFIRWGRDGAGWPSREWALAGGLLGRQQYRKHSSWQLLYFFHVGDPYPDVEED